MDLKAIFKKACCRLDSRFAVLKSNEIRAEMETKGWSFADQIIYPSAGSAWGVPLCLPVVYTNVKTPDGVALHDGSDADRKAFRVERRAAAEKVYGLKL